MRYILVLISLFCSHSVFACPEIIGTWKSSAELSLKYNAENLELEPRTIEFMEQAYGVLTLTYGEDTVRAHGAPTKKIMISGKEYDFAYDEMEYPYKILSCTNDTLTVKENNPYLESIEVKHFINQTTYWVPAMPKSDIREYFVRISD